MTFGGVDTYYDYDERQWKLRRLGGGPVRRERVCPAETTSSDESANEDSKHPRETNPADEVRSSRSIS
jgi:hypothetical protein